MDYKKTEDFIIGKIKQAGFKNAITFSEVDSLLLGYILPTLTLAGWGLTTEHMEKNNIIAWFSKLQQSGKVKIDADNKRYLILDEAKDEQH